MKVTFTKESMVKGLSGKMGDLVFVQRNGQTFAYKANRQSKRAPSKRELLGQNNFAKASEMTQEILSSPTLRATYEMRFRKQSRYKTLRGLIFASMYQMLKGGVV